MGQHDAARQGLSREERLVNEPFLLCSPQGGKREQAQQERQGRHKRCEYLPTYRPKQSKQPSEKWRVHAHHAIAWLYPRRPEG